MPTFAVHSAGALAAAALIGAAAAAGPAAGQGAPPPLGTPPGAPPGAEGCAGCHPASPDTGAITGAPVALASLPPEEIIAAMRAFRGGERPATVMDRIAKGYSDEEIRAIAAWVGRTR
ncbi:MAG TPA: sulfide dehydrogenase [Azospirillum sp.]|nr:sulfide dehydrogenase [Azospirillum sp.]